MAALPERREGRTVFGSNRIAACTVAVNSKAGSSSGLTLVDSDGVAWYLWVDTTGDLKVSSTIADFETNPNSAGTVVGGQS